MSTDGKAMNTLRIPLEVWENIFQYCLGPPLVNPDQISLRAYRLLFSSLSKPEFLKKYMEKERLRGLLRLVSRSWKEVADQMGDKIVVSHLDQHDWPPNRPRKSAKLIFYSHYLLHKPNNPVHAYRERVGASYPPYNDRVPIDLSLPLAPVSLINISTLVPPPEDVDVEATVRVLDWGTYANINIFMHPLFRNLTILMFFIHYPPQLPKTEEQKLNLPLLRGLCIGAGVRNRDEICSSRFISAWNFPSLTMFHFGSWCPTPADDLIAFINKHSSKIEDLGISGSAATPFLESADWSQFGRLKAIQMPNLGQLILLLPQMEAFWRSDSTEDCRYPVGRRVEVELTDAALQLERHAAAETLERYQWMVKNALFVLSITWSELADRIPGNKNKAFCVGVRDLYHLVEQFDLNFIDFGGETFHSDAAIAVKKRWGVKQR